MLPRGLMSSSALVSQCGRQGARTRATSRSQTRKSARPWIQTIAHWLHPDLAPDSSGPLMNRSCFVIRKCIDKRNDFVISVIRLQSQLLLSVFGGGVCSLLRCSKFQGFTGGSTEWNRKVLGYLTGNGD